MLSWFIVYAICTRYWSPELDWPDCMKDLSRTFIKYVTFYVTIFSIIRPATIYFISRFHKLIWNNMWTILFVCVMFIQVTIILHMEYGVLPSIFNCSFIIWSRITCKSYYLFWQTGTDILRSAMSIHTCVSNIYLRGSNAIHFYHCCSFIIWHRK